MTFRPGRAWDALDIATKNGITVRLHGTDPPYRWHVDDGEARILVVGREGSI